MTGMPAFPAIASRSRAGALAAILLGTLVTVGGVLLLHWDLQFVLILLMLEVSASAAGLSWTIALHQRATGDPAHLQEQFTGWLRARGGRAMPFAEAVMVRTVYFPATVAGTLLLIIVQRASAPLVEAVVPLLSMGAVCLFAAGETAPLRRRIARVPFAALRARGIAMVYREAMAYVFFFAGLVWMGYLEQPPAIALVAYVLCKATVDCWAVLRLPDA